MRVVKAVNRVVITGLGWTTSLGADVETCWTRLIAGDSGIRTIDRWDASEYKTKLAGIVSHVPGETGSSLPRASMRRSVKLFLPAAAEAFCNSRLDATPVLEDRIGLAVGVSANYLNQQLVPGFFQSWESDSDTLHLSTLLRAGAGSTDIFYRSSGDTIQSATARLLKLGGPCLTTDTACAASAHAIGEAYRLVRRGRADVMLAGGTAALISPIGILAFSLLGALSKSADPKQGSRPFDKGRDGFVMGEAAGVVALESLASAQRREARIYAELVGYGTTSNAGNLTDPSPDGSAEARAMSLALTEAGIHPDQVDYIAAHGTSTPKNDLNETVAIKKVFGSHARKLAVSSNKGQIGHTISAAAVSNVICSVRAMTDSRIPPTMNLVNPDADCDLDYVPNCSRGREVRVALANAFAFGGQNAVLAMKAWDGR